MPVCPHCGEEVSEGITYCPDCGQRLKKGFTPEERQQHIDELRGISVEREGEVKQGKEKYHWEARTGGNGPYKPDAYRKFRPTYSSSYGHRTTYEPQKKSRRAPKIIGIALACILVTVLLVIIVPDLLTPSLSVDPLDFTFRVPDGLNPPTQTLEIESSGRAITWFAIDDAQWLGLDPMEASTDEERPVTLSVDISGMYPGEYTATITIHASETRNVVIEIPTSLVITETVETLAIKEGVRGNTNNLEIYYDKQPPYSGMHLINSRDATNPTWGQLLKFIRSDDTDQQTYIEGVYMCGSFAETVHNNAEQEGIRAAWVAIDFADDSDSHALNAFYTVDMGLVFVDCTGGGFEMAIPSAGDSYDKIAYVRVGAEYGLASLRSTRWPSYEFYEDYLQDCRDYERRLEEYNERVDEYTSLLGGRTVIDNIFEYWKLETMYNELEEERVALESLQEILGDCRWESLSVVSYVEVYW